MGSWESRAGLSHSLPVPLARPGLPHTRRMRSVSGSSSSFRICSSSAGSMAAAEPPLQGRVGRRGRSGTWKIGHQLPAERALLCVAPVCRLGQFASLKKFVLEAGVSHRFRQDEHRLNHRNRALATWVPHADSSQGSRVCAAVADWVFKELCIDNRPQGSVAKPKLPTTGSFFLINFILICKKKKIRTKT